MLAFVSRFAQRPLRIRHQFLRSVFASASSPLRLLHSESSKKSRPHLKATSSFRTSKVAIADGEHAIHATKYYQHVGGTRGDEFTSTAYPDPNSIFLPVLKATDAARWAGLFDRYLPPNLRVAPTASDDQVRVNCETSLREIDAICSFASRFRRQLEPTEAELLGWMFQNDRAEAALYLIRQLLTSIAQRVQKPALNPPSNISWPQQPLNVFCRKPIEAESTTAHESEQERLLESVDDDKASSVVFNVLNHVYATLGQLVVNSADDANAQSQEMMTTVMLVLSEIHNLGLMPDQIYSHNVSPYTSFLHRPPIMHLLTSRILTSISDAAWREHSDKAIAQARNSGIDNRLIAIDPPGGRFRLKVRPLGPEAWIEMILWCCVESAAIYPALRIIKMLKMRSQNPWYAISWTSNGLSPTLGASVDWDRVQLRHGGPVGLIEGYSREKPFVEMPERTISREVVLALLDLVMNSVGPSPTGTETFRASRIVQKDIVDIVSFLEPHDLPVEYFDCLSVRLDQNGALDLDQDANSLKSWSEKLAGLRSLEQAPRTQQPEARSLNLSNIFEQSELQAGILHQALYASIRAGDFHDTSQIFNDIQKLVDQSKLSAISNFLGLPTSAEDGFFSSHPSSHAEFVQSHGQLPLYKLAGLINHISDSNMPGLGKWLIYAEDVDGPLIPPSSYGLPSMTAALARFASITGDVDLFNKVLESNKNSRLRRTVRVLRSLVDAHVEFLDFGAARESLSQLRSAQGGGFDSGNTAQVAATILRLEFSSTPMDQMRRDMLIARAVDLLHDIIGGRYDSHRADFTHAQRVQFQQQTSHLLQMFRFCGSPTLSAIARMYQSKLKFGNVTDLPVASFNRILAAVLDVHGAEAGMELWKTFCKLADNVVDSFSTYDDAGEAHVIEQLRTGLSNTETIPWDMDVIPANKQPTSISVVDADMRNQTPANVHQPDHGSLDLQDVSSIEDGDLLNNKTTFPFPITVPDSHTLRLIVRCHLQKQPPPSERLQTMIRKDPIMPWAFEKCKELRIHPKSISREIRESFKDPSVEYWVPRTKSSSQITRKSKPKSPVNPSFRGTSHIRSASR